MDYMGTPESPQTEFFFCLFPVPPAYTKMGSEPTTSHKIWQRCCRWWPLFMLHSGWTWYSTWPKREMTGNFSRSPANYTECTLDNKTFAMETNLLLSQHLKYVQKSHKHLKESLKGVLCATAQGFITPDRMQNLFFFNEIICLFSTLMCNCLEVADKQDRKRAEYKSARQN